MLLKSEWVSLESKKMNYSEQSMLRGTWILAALLLWANTVLAEVAAVEQESVADHSSETTPVTQDRASDVLSEGEAALRDEGTSEAVDSAPSSARPLLVQELPEEEEGWSIALRLGFGLGLVILLAWGASQLLRRSALGRQLGTDSGIIRVAERVYLGPKKAVFLVDIGGRVLALGVTEEHINTLAEWGAGELELAERHVSASPFAAQLKKLLGQTPREKQ